MKSKEEIDKIYLEVCKDSGSKEIASEYCGFTKGYLQCQEDMADKKYTERQLRDAMEGAMVFNKIKQITEYIISLNKQD
jgi:hypothetical protein